MKISAIPNLCILHFDVKIGDISYKASLDQKIGGTEEIMISLFDTNGSEISDESLVGLIKSYLIQKYSIAYDTPEGSIDNIQEDYYHSKEVKLDPPI